MKRYQTVQRGNDIAVVDENGKEESRYPSQDLAQIRLSALAYPEAWRKRIAKALPRKLKPAYRAALTTRIAERIETWHAIHPEIAPYREKLKRISREVDRVTAVILRVNANLSKIGGNVGPGRNSAEGELNLILSRANHDLVDWNRLWRPRASRPPKFSVSLVSTLKDEFNLYCGKGARGFATLLKVLQHPATQRLPHMYGGRRKLPSLTISAIQKRKRRKADKVVKK